MSLSPPTLGTPEISLAYAARTLPEHDYDVLLEVKVDWAERRLRVIGELDVATTGVLAEAIALLIGPVPDGDVTICLDEVTFMDASGVGVLMSAAGQLTSVGQVLRLDGCMGASRDLLILTGAAAALLPDNPSPRP